METCWDRLSQNQHSGSVKDIPKIPKSVKTENSTSNHNQNPLLVTLQCLSHNCTGKYKDRSDMFEVKCLDPSHNSDRRIKSHFEASWIEEISCGEKRID